MIDIVTDEFSNLSNLHKYWMKKCFRDFIIPIIRFKRRKENLKEKAIFF